MLTISVLYWRKRGGSAESGVFLPTRMRSRSVVVVWRHPTMYMLPNAGRPIILRAFVEHRLSVFFLFKIAANGKNYILTIHELDPVLTVFHFLRRIRSGFIISFCRNCLDTATKKRNGRHFETAQLITLKFTLQLIVNILISPNLSKLLSRFKKTIGDYSRY